MSITIKSFATGLSGKLQSGDIVSVVAPDFKKQGQTVIPPELKYVEVIGVTASSGYDANTDVYKRQGLSATDHGYVAWNGGELHYEYSDLGGSPMTAQTM